MVVFKDANYLANLIEIINRTQDYKYLPKIKANIKEFKGNIKELLEKEHQYLSEMTDMDCDE